MRNYAVEKPLTMQVPLTSSDRSRLDAVCGPGKKEKRGQWVAEAIRRYLDEVGARSAERGGSG